MHRIIAFDGLFKLEIPRGPLNSTQLAGTNHGKCGLHKMTLSL